MNKHLLSIDPHKEKETIVVFLKKIFQQQKINKAVIGLSGGIDSMVSYYLLKKALPKKNIYPVHLPYTKPSPLIPKNIPVISITEPVEKIIKTIKKSEGSENTVSSISKIRLGNIMARIRMIILYDLAKKYNALVCGTENKSEYLLGYFTRFGDEASDIEPIRHLYKTQVYQLAKYLHVPQEIIDQPPTAGLWTGQTDEKEFGFTYKEADQVLYLYFGKKKNISEIKKIGFKNTQIIIFRTIKNSYKHNAPYITEH